MRKQLLILFAILATTLGVLFAQGVLIVEEEDGSPAVYGVWKIRVTNGQLTDDGGGVVTIDVGTTSTTTDTVTWNNETDTLTWNNETDTVTWTT